jgi:phosphate transport system substrate-binding protein
MITKRVLSQAVLGLLILGSAAASMLIPGAASAQTLVNGAGATFPYPIYSKWFDEYHKLHPNAQINYQSIGSGGGIRQISELTVDFGATDGPMTDEQLSKAKSPVFHLPTVLGGVVPIYNIPGVSAELKFTPKALSGIFMGTIRKWNDPEITSANPGVPLPGNDIVVVHRSDGSGTTYCWTDYLSKVSPGWRAQVGRSTSVNWPVGLGAKGNEGVAGLVKQTPNAMGYVELIYATQNNIPYGSVENSSGSFVKASLESVTAAAAGAGRNMPADFRVSITNAAGRNAYPISTFTWLLVPQQVADATKGKILVDFLKWMLGEGQRYAAGLGYAPLPPEVIEMEKQTIAKIQY